MGVLKQQFGERFEASEAMRRHHVNSTTWLEAQLPDCVVFPHDTGEVASVLKTCNAYGVPVIPFGAGTSVEGHVNAPRGGVSMDFSKMANILEIVPEDLIAVVQPGVTRKRLNEELRATGLHFPIDPGADASIGGMVSTRASGTNAVRYGTMAENVLALECVLANGEIIRTGTRAKKSSAGYDLTRLLVGSEGTLAAITEITVKLHGIPEHIVAGVATFPSIEAACNAVISCVQCGLNVGRLELLDTAQISACNRYSKLDLTEAPTLFFEFAGMEDAVKAEFKVFRELLDDAGAKDIKAASNADEIGRLWKARHDAYWAAVAAMPGKSGHTTDACVPISHLAESIKAAQNDLAELGLPGTIVGHVGDGNFHVLIGIDPLDPDETAKAHKLLEQISERAIKVGGTCTGEHGIGQGKRETLLLQSGNAVNVMAAIKQSLDPKAIMNPGKVLPDSF
nr:FAD-linked oxidase C-terminal domain-containing protein [Hoeflea prorocentri]